MKKILLKLLAKNGYSIIKTQELQAQANRTSKMAEAMRELYFLASEDDLLYLPENLPDELVSCTHDLIGTSPYEGYSILNALYATIDEPGDICEFGIAQGATSKLFGTWIKSTGSSKKLWLFDSFQGLSKPTAEDKLKDDIFNLGSMEAYGGAMAYEKEVALKKLKDINFPQQQLRVVPGFIEESINGNLLPEKVSFAYVDFDLYQPIKVALQFLSEKLSPKGVIVVDDYDFFSTGAKQAVDEFMGENEQQFNIDIPPKPLGHFCILRRNHARPPR